MKHLISFNESNENIELISKYINWDLIERAKELSLELLDDGYIVNLEIKYKIWGNYFTIYEIDWEHNEIDNANPWNLSSIRAVLNSNTVLSKDHFYYVFNIFKMQFEPYEVEDLDKQRMDEFISILKELYPDNNIIT
jgi:hypothetical protein